LDLITKVLAFKHLYRYSILIFLLEKTGIVLEYQYFIILSPFKFVLCSHVDVILYLNGFHSYKYFKFYITLLKGYCKLMNNNFNNYHYYTKFTQKQSRKKEKN